MSLILSESSEWSELHGPSELSELVGPIVPSKLSSAVGWASARGAAARCGCVVLWRCAVVRRAAGAGAVAFAVVAVAVAAAAAAAAAAAVVELLLL